MKIGSKERVLAAIGHRETDRVPLDFGANPGTLERLKRDLNVSGHRELLDRLHVDVVDLRGVVDPIYRGPIPKERVREDGVKENYLGWRTKVMQTATGPEECHCENVLSEAKSVEELQDHPWPRADWFDFSDFADRLAPWEDMAVMASGPSVFQHLTFLRGLENLLADMILRPDIFDYLVDRLTDFYVEYFDRLFSTVPGKIDILRVADDLAMQDRLLISPASFDRQLGPRIARLVDLAHSHGVKLMFHSCGAVVPLIDRLIELGVDILDPIQVRATGMDPACLKETFGDRITLHGSIDTQYVLPRGTPDDVRHNVRKMIEILSPGGGFILAPSHVLQTDVSTENIVALYETAGEYSTGR